MLTLNCLFCLMTNMNQAQAINIMFAIMDLDCMSSSLIADLPPDSEVCLQCKHHPNNAKFDGDDIQHCYMFSALPESLCMQFEKAK